MSLVFELTKQHVFLSIDTCPLDYQTKIGLRVAASIMFHSSAVSLGIFDQSVLSCDTSAYISRSPETRL